MFTIKRLNHIVLYVRDAARARAFYQDVLGFQVVETMGDQAVFLRANGSDNHHDLGLFGVGPQAASPSRGERVGLYHAAWEVATIEDLARAREALVAAGALGGESDHGNSLSLLGTEPECRALSAVQGEAMALLSVTESHKQGGIILRA
jgi:catechol-2,3-dioxygenase